MTYAATDPDPNVSELIPQRTTCGGGVLASSAAAYLQTVAATMISFGLRDYGPSNWI